MTSTPEIIEIVVPSPDDAPEIVEVQVPGPPGAGTAEALAAAEEAEASALAAAGSATAAATSATNSNNSAIASAGSADDADAAKVAAEAARDISIAKAGIATTKAGEADASALAATNAAGDAEDARDDATTQAGIATTKAGEADDSAVAAAASQIAAAASAASASTDADRAEAAADAAEEALGFDPNDYLLKATYDPEGDGVVAEAASVPWAGITDKPDFGTASELDAGTAPGNVPVLDVSGLLDAAVLPPIAITDTHVVADQTAMLALTAQKGDVAVRTDLNKTFVLATNSPSTLADWKEMLTPTDLVLSVAGLTGAISAAALKVALDFPSGSLVGTTDAQTLYNKTYSGGTFSGTFAGSHTLTGNQIHSRGIATSPDTYEEFITTDYGPGNPKMFVAKSTTATQWNISLYDTVGSAGTINFVATTLSLNGSPLMSRAATETITGAKTFAETIAVSKANATTVANYLSMLPTNYGVGNYGLIFQKSSTANAWNVLVNDGVDNNGTVNWVAGNFQVNGSNVMTRGATETITGAKTISVSNATTFAGYLAFQPTDWGTGKPRLSIDKSATANQWVIGLYDGVNNAGTIEIYSSGFTWQGQTVMTRGATETITGAKTFTAGATTFAAAGNTALEIGRTDGVASSAHIDFHSGATATDFDARIIATGGNGSNGGGILTFQTDGVYANGYTRISTGNSTTLQTFLDLVPTDSGVGKPSFFIQKSATATTWSMGLWDSATSNGTLEFVVQNVSFTGSTKFTAGITIEGSYPQTWYKIGGAGAVKNWWTYADGDSFLILNDTNGDNTWEGVPWPFQLNTSEGYVYGSKIMTVGSNDTITGTKTFAGGVVIQSSVPQINLVDTDVAAIGRNWYIHLNGDNFWVLRDSDGVGGYDTYPLRLDGAGGVGYIFNSQIATWDNTMTFVNKTISGVTLTNGYTEEFAALNSGTNVAIALSNGTVQTITLTGNWNPSSWPTAFAGMAFTLFIKQDGTGGRTITWPSSVKWPGGVAPTITSTANKVDKITFQCPDGTNWFAVVNGQNYL